MVWFFAAVVLLLLVYNRGFRRFMLWAGGAAALVAAIAIGAFAVDDYRAHHWLDAQSTVVPGANFFDQFDQAPNARTFDPSTAVPVDGPPIDPSKVHWDQPPIDPSKVHWDQPPTEPGTLWSAIGWPVVLALGFAAVICWWKKFRAPVGSLAWARSRIRKL
jgi:hypothetical protein